MEIKKEQVKIGAILQDLIPFFMLLAMIGAGILIYMFFFNEKVEKITSTQQIGVIVNSDFLQSETLTSLKFIPDGAVFNEVVGTVPSGKSNPFAP